MSTLERSLKLKEFAEPTTVPASNISTAFVTTATAAKLASVALYTKDMLTKLLYPTKELHNTYKRNSRVSTQCAFTTPGVKVWVNLKFRNIGGHSHQKRPTHMT